MISHQLAREQQLREIFSRVSPLKAKRNAFFFYLLYLRLTNNDRLSFSLFRFIVNIATVIRNTSDRARVMIYLASPVQRIHLLDRKTM